MFTVALGLISLKGGGVALSLLVGVVGMSWIASEPFVAYLQSIGVLGSTGLPTLKRKIVAKIADYVMTAAVDEPGTLFTNTGAAGSVTFTLPAPSALLAGWEYEFFSAVAQNMVVSAGAGNAVTFNNAAAASLAASTAGQKIGARIKASCDGAKWHLQGNTVGVTYTVA